MGKADWERVARQRQIRSTGIVYEASRINRLDRTLAETPRNEHLWIMTAAWRVDPEKLQDPEYTYYFDAESLLTTEGPGCYKCEKPYDRELAGQPCREI